MIRTGIPVVLLWTLMVQVRQGFSVPVPQVLPGQIPPHLATHPALSSVTQGRESALMQYAYNIQNRRGPSPSPLVLQNNQERNLQFANQLSQQRSGQAFIPSNVGGHSNTNGHSHSGHSHGNENPELRAFEEIQKYKGQTQTSSNYNPSVLTPANQNQPIYHTSSGVGVGPSAIPPNDDNEGEDIKKLKSILALAGRPVQGSSPNYGNNGIPSGARSPQIGVAGERGVLNPAQFGQNSQHNHDHHHAHAHHHPTPFPVTAQSQNSLGNIQYGQSPRPSVYPGPGSASPAPSVVHVPYGSDGHQHAHHHGHDPHHHGQDARTLIQSLETSSDAYQNLVYIDPVREPTSINKHVGPSQSVFILPASDYPSDDFQRLLNRPAEILIDVIPTGPANGKQTNPANDLTLHNFSLLLTPSTYARCAQATHKRGYGGKCKLILRVGTKGTSSGPKPVQVQYK